MAAIGGRALAVSDEMGLRHRGHGGPPMRPLLQVQDGLQSGAWPHSTFLRIQYR